MLLPIFLCLFLRFQSPRSLRIDCASVFVRVVSPVERVSGKTPKNLRLHRWLALFCPRLSPLPLLLLPNPRLSPDPFSFSFSFRAGFRPRFPFPFSPGCECLLTHWSPEPGQRVVPPFCGGSIPLQWSPDLEDPVHLDKLPLVLSFFRSTKGASFPFQGWLFKKQALACRRSCEHQR